MERLGKVMILEVQGERSCRINYHWHKEHDDIDSIEQDKLDFHQKTGFEFGYFDIHSLEQVQVEVIEGWLLDHGYEVSAIEIIDLNTGQEIDF